MPYTGDTFAHLFDWETDPQRQEKIVNSRLESEFDGLDTGLSAVAARVTTVEGVAGTVGQIPGTTTNDNAAAGKVGEYTSSTVTSGSAVSLTTATTANVTSVSLTAGDWNVWGFTYTNPSLGAATLVSSAVSSTSATLPTFASGDPGRVTSDTAGTCVQHTGIVRFSLASTTTIYLVVNSTFAAGTNAAHGTICARRVR